MWTYQWTIRQDHGYWNCPTFSTSVHPLSWLTFNTKCLRVTLTTLKLPRGININGFLMSKSKLVCRDDRPNSILQQTFVNLLNLIHQTSKPTTTITKSRHFTCNSETHTSVSSLPLHLDLPTDLPLQILYVHAARPATIAYHLITITISDGVPHMQSACFSSHLFLQLLFSHSPFFFGAAHFLVNKVSD